MPFGQEFESMDPLVATVSATSNSFSPSVVLIWAWCLSFRSFKLSYPTYRSNHLCFQHRHLFPVFGLVVAPVFGVMAGSFGGFLSDIFSLLKG